MSSVFDLAQSAQELPSLNHGMAKLTYNQIAPMRTIVGDAFPNGKIIFKWDTSGNLWWIPVKSYLRMRLEITKAGGAPLDATDDIAVNMGGMSNLWQKASVLMNKKTVSAVNQFFPQTEMLAKRLDKSGKWMNSVGEDLEYLSPYYKDRHSAIINDGVYDYHENEAKSSKSAIPMAITANTLDAGFLAVATLDITAVGVGTFAAGGTTTLLDVGDVIAPNTVGAYVLGERYQVTEIVDGVDFHVIRLDAPIAARGAQVVAGFTIEKKKYQPSNRAKLRSGVELIWRPSCLGLFNVTHGIPSSQFELRLEPESVNVYKKKLVQSLLADKAPGAGNDYDINVVDMYLYTAVVEGPAVDNLSYFMSLDNIRCQVENIVAGGFQTKVFVVNQNANALTVAFQHQDLSVTNHADSILKTESPNTEDALSGELLLNRFQITFDGETKPDEQADPEYKSPDGYFMNRYAENQLYSGGYFDPYAGESFNEWVERGPYFYFPYPRDGNAKSENVTVKYGFSSQLLNANVLLFDHSPSMVSVNIENGLPINTTVVDQ